MTAPRCRVALLPDSHLRPGAENSLECKPARRLYGHAQTLLARYVTRIAEMEVDAIFLLGDTLDPATPANLVWLRELIANSAIPIHVIIGNHEGYGTVSAREFHEALGLPPSGNYVARVAGVPFIMLATPDQDTLTPGSTGFAWLTEQLKALRGEDVFCCAHFSLLLHPCVQGWRNDGMQVLWAGDAILELLRQHRHVRAWIAGHKNIASKVVQDGVLHFLSPQLIQAPCEFRILEIHEAGLRSETYPIAETELADLSRLAWGSGYGERCGRCEDRNFHWSWPDLAGCQASCVM